MIYKYREHEGHLEDMIKIVTSGIDNGLCGPGEASEAFSRWADNLAAQQASTHRKREKLQKIMIGEANPGSDTTVSSIDYNEVTQFEAPEVPLTEHLRSAMEKMGISHVNPWTGSYGNETGSKTKRKAKQKPKKKSAKMDTVQIDAGDDGDDEGKASEARIDPL